MLQLFITRHGQGVHNIRENERVWKYSNDDILGLTMEGIDQTYAKGLKLAKDYLNPAVPVAVVCSGQVRSFQTASLISDVLYNNGFKESLINASPITPMKWAQETLLREFPTPDRRHAWDSEFDFSKFSEDIHYTNNGFCESFYERVSSCLDAMAPNRLVSFMDMFTQQLRLDRRSKKNAQVVIVGHHYATMAFVCAAYLQSSRLNKDSGRKASDEIELFHQTYLTHQDVLYLTPFFNENGTDAFGRIYECSPFWNKTVDTLGIPK